MVPQVAGPAALHAPVAPDPREALAAWYLRRRHRVVWLLPLTAALAGLVVLLFLRGTAEDPQANYQASRAALLALAPPSVPTGENAADDYVRAVKATVPCPAKTRQGRSDEDPYRDASIDSKHLEDASVQAYLAINAAALQLLHAGAAKTRCNWGVDYSLGYAYPSYLSDQHDSARLLALHARVCAHAGDHQTAAQSWAAIYKLARHVGATPLLYCGNETMGLAGVADEAMQGIVTWDTPAAPSDLAAYRKALWRSRDPEKTVTRCLAGEKAFGLYTLDAVTVGAMPAPRSIASELGRMTHGKSGSLLYGSERQCLAAVMDDIVARVSRGVWFTREQAAELVANHQKGPATLAVLAASAYGTYFRDIARSEERARVIDAGLAFLQFRVTHARDPKALEELVPEFLPVVPRGVFHPALLRMYVDEKGVAFRDPATGERLWRDPGTIRIYALGPDGRDDSGYSERDEYPNSGRISDDAVISVPPMKRSGSATGGKAP